MASTRLYAIIYVVLFAFATAQVAVEYTFLEQQYLLGLTAIMVLSVIKALFVVGYYQHLKYEPRGLTYLMLGGVAAVIALTTAAAYSIT